MRLDVGSSRHWDRRFLLRLRKPEVSGRSREGMVMMWWWWGDPDGKGKVRELTTVGTELYFYPLSGFDDVKFNGCFPLELSCLMTNRSCLT